MAIKSSLLGKILEELASLRTNITIRLDNDRLKEDDDECQHLTKGPFGWPGSATGKQKNAHMGKLNSDP